MKPKVKELENLVDMLEDRNKDEEDIEKEIRINKAAIKAAGRANTYVKIELTPQNVKYEGELYWITNTIIEANRAVASAQNISAPPNENTTDKDNHTEAKKTVNRANKIESMEDAIYG